MSIAEQRRLAIGVFDSGLGGLTVVKELMRTLPHEDIVYFGDTARVPYGTKSKESIIRFSKENVEVLLKHRVKMIVVACNTSSSLALPILKRTFTLPILGVIRPGARKAAAVTRNQKIGVIATPATINSGAYARAIKKENRRIVVSAKACPLFVPLAEEGWVDRKITEDIAREYLGTLLAARVDTLILGCTHYPLLKPLLQKVVGKHVLLVDSAMELASEVKELLNETGMAQQGIRKPKYQFLVSDQPKHFRRLARRFLGYSVKNVRRCHNV